jgi:hypothetical protein
MGKARYWAALTIGVAILEALGVFRDLGIVVSVGALALTVLFGLTASALHERSLALHERTLALLDERLPRPTS